MEELAQRATRRVAWLAATWTTLGLAAATPAAAQHYDFDLTRVEFSGVGSFVDDFADGDRNAPPTDGIDDLFGTTTEEPGALRFTTADGAEAFEPVPPFDAEGATGFRDVALLGGGTGAAFVDGGGPATFRTHWAGPPPEISGFDHDRHFFSQVIFQGGSTTGALSLSVIQSAYTGSFAAGGCQGEDPRVLMVYSQAFLIQFACDPFDPADVSGDIVLEVSFDDAANTMSFAYSLDGGATFVPSSSWQNGAASFSVSDTIAGGFAVAGMGASATRLPSQLPGPGAGLAVFLLAAGWGAARRRPEGHA